jgi:hypothetical protein
MRSDSSTRGRHWHIAGAVVRAARGIVGSVGRQPIERGKLAIGEGEGEGQQITSNSAPRSLNCLLHRRVGLLSLTMRLRLFEAVFQSHHTQHQPHFLLG